MPLIGTVSTALVLGPGFVVLMTAQCLALFFLHRLPAPSRRLNGPPRFVAETGAPAKRRFYTLAWADLLLAFVPGLLAWRSDRADEAIKQAAVGWGGVLVLLVAPADALWLGLAGMAGYWISYHQALGVARGADAVDRWVAFLVGIDADMARAECALPSCPRCRLRDRQQSGWCGPCHDALSSRELARSDWRARVGSRHEVHRDGSLFPHCARRMTRSYFGSGGSQYAIARKARRTGRPLADPPARSDDPQWTTEVEVAYADPARADLVWVRTRECLAPPNGDAYESRHVEAWGFVDERFLQAWVFAPISRGVPSSRLVTASSR